MDQGRFPFHAVILVAVLGAVFSWPYLDPLFEREIPAQNIQQANVLSPIVSQEEVFDVPVPANWQGTVIGVLEGGRAYAIERSNKDRFYAFFVEDPNVLLEGNVRIRGLWLGKTCAYRNTVFDGECVPEVRISSFDLMDVHK